MSDQGLSLRKFYCTVIVPIGWLIAFGSIGLKGLVAFIATVSLTALLLAACSDKRFSSAFSTISTCIAVWLSIYISIQFLIGGMS